MTTMRERLATGAVSVGPFLKLTDPGVIEIMGLAGFGHAIIDLEHGPLTMETAQDLIRAAEVAGIEPMVRVQANEESEILRALDIGATGVHIPHVDSVEAAQRALAACCYHPLGHRGVCRYVRAARYTARTKEEHFARANATVVPVLHIEGVDGIDALPEILELDGHGIVFIGPYDLSQSCGHPGEVHHPDVVARMQRAVELGAEKGVVIGTFVDSPADARTWIGRGVRYICLSVDVGILFDAASALMSQVQASAGR